ncbi:penicillin-binding protein 1A [Aliihoeflea sp. PC F10.4]
MIRLIGYFFGIGVMLALVVAVGVAAYIGTVSRDLPDYEVLARYEPPVTTRVHASDGALMAEFAREQRLYLPIQAIPDRVKAAFLSAEDKNFYQHPGIDVVGIVRALVTNVRTGSMQGGSTITQQVAKNFLLDSEQTYERKVREMILSFRIEQAYSKDRILELYLNEIYFGFVFPGRGAYGIAAAALVYFDKAVNELTVSEMAYLAALPRGPSNYHPFRHTQRALDRRNWVIDQMVANGFVEPEEGARAKAEDLGVNARRGGTYMMAGEYFTEDVRREMIARYGEDALYAGGLSVRTTLDPQTQLLARKSLQHGLIRYDTLRGFRGPVEEIELGDDWGAALGQVRALSDVPEWRLAVVLETSGSDVSVGLQPARQASGELVEDRETATLSVSDMEWALRHTVNDQRVRAGSIGEVLQAGDVVYVEEKPDGGWMLRQVPQVSGGMVAMDPQTGRVLAMVGGFSFAQSEFNRATQAMRQPGSSFKPILYAAALDNGYTPASVVDDAPISIRVGNDVWEPRNYGGDFAGPSTLRMGIERSRNLMTVRLANDMGMDIVAEYAERFGVYDKMLPVLAMSLGSGETTVMRMVSAYAVMANGGRYIQPSLVDRIQDRYGKTVFKHDQRVCHGCNAATWESQSEPELIDERDQVLDPMTAYQITSMMEGVVQRGTATTLAELGHPIAGKTGTTNDARDVWFVGYTPDLVVGLYVGYDQPRSLGSGATGGGLAAPIFKEFMAEALKDKTPVAFRVPEGMQQIAINRQTGMRARQGEGGTIMEAFKPGTGPADSYWVIGMDGATAERAREISPQASEALISGSGGGLY